jgi:hypothetical protein
MRARNKTVHVGSGVTKGSRKNKFPAFALRFAPDSVAAIERIRRSSRDYDEEFAIEGRRKMV